MKTPYWAYDDVKIQAEAFLHQYHSSRELPVPIEEIIDNDIGLHIVLFPNLYRVYRHSGFLSHDHKMIFVDEYQYYNYPGKYRFTLAHEIGHYVLHPEFYNIHKFRDLEDYIQWRLSLPSETLHWLNTHAGWFAGCVLVPSDLLEQHCIKFLDEDPRPFSEEFWQTGDFWEYAAKDLCQYFDVNPATVAFQIKKEKIIEKLIRKIKES